MVWETAGDITSARRSGLSYADIEQELQTGEHTVSMQDNSRALYSPWGKERVASIQKGSPTGQASMRAGHKARDIQAQQKAGTAEYAPATAGPSINERLAARRRALEAQRFSLSLPPTYRAALQQIGGAQAGV